MDSELAFDRLATALATPRKRYSDVVCAITLTLAGHALTGIAIGVGIAAGLAFAG